MGIAIQASIGCSSVAYILYFVYCRVRRHRSLRFDKTALVGDLVIARRAAPPPPSDRERATRSSPSGLFFASLRVRARGLR